MSYRPEDEGRSFNYSNTVACSYPKVSYGYDEEGENDPFPSDEAQADNKPRILLMGLKRSGKSSIQKVVFTKMAPHETLFLDGTPNIVKEDISSNSFVQFQVWDLPGHLDWLTDPTFDSTAIFGGCGALIYVIDAQDDYSKALDALKATTVDAYKINPNIKFQVFIHKVDGLSDDDKMDKQRDIHQRANEDVFEAGLDVTYSFFLTSIYDYSIFEAFSKVVQKLIPQLPALENLLNMLIQNSSIEKAFLFDVVSKIYIATDCMPVDMQSYELCCDMIDVVIDISCIYGASDDEVTAFDNKSASIIKLNNQTILYLREVNRSLALVCILREESFVKHGLIDYNFHCFREAIQDIFELSVPDQGDSQQNNHSQKTNGFIRPPTP